MLKVLLTAGLAMGGAVSLHAQAAQPARLPPPDSPPLVQTIEIAFPTQGNVPVVDPQTYLYYIRTRGSQPSRDVWVPYDEQAVLEDFRRLWGTGFLDDLWIEVNDVPYPNGVQGKHIVYNMEERERVRIVDYLGSDKLDRSKIEEVLIEAESELRLDSFIDPGRINRIENILRMMLAEEGYHTPEITHEVTEVAGGPKYVHLTFNIDDGPQTKIRRIEFIGNEVMDDGKLRGQMKANREEWWLGWFTSRGTYKEHRFAEDADAIIQFYRNEGYVNAQVGQPELRTLEDSDDGKKRWVELRIPIAEGERYRIGTLTFDGAEVYDDAVLRQVFDLEEGDFYNEQKVRDGLELAKNLYGATGYFEFVGFPDLQPRDQLAEDGDGLEEAASPAIVDVTLRLDEGEQYFVNRITFKGNTTTRDTVIRREMRLLENGVFNTEALKFSIRRLNQLGYFSPVDEEENVEISKLPGDDNKVDVEVELEEQNRNQLTFGAGVSEFEGFFGQVSFQTSNFLGRGETLSVLAQGGSRAQNYQLGFTKPYLFERPISVGSSIFKQSLRFPFQFTQRSVGTTFTLGRQVANFTRMFLGYSYEEVEVTELNPLFTDPQVLQFNPFLRDSLLIGQDGRRTVSKVIPSLVHNTIDNPIFPNRGKRLSMSIELAGLGGNTDFLKPRFEGIWYFQRTPRTSFGLRTQIEYIRPYGDTVELPIFERLYLGGEYSVRGYDIRSIGPRDPLNGLVIGGTKSLLFNGEYLISIADPVRLILFYDAGQVLDSGQRFSVDEFRTSTGAEVRFFMPVLNVPFRLIFAFNPQRDGVLDNNFQPAKAFAVRFAIGSTF